MDKITKFNITNTVEYAYADEQGICVLGTRLSWEDLPLFEAWLRVAKGEHDGVLSMP